MRILVLNHEFPPVGGGASPMSWQLCRELVRLGHGVDVVTMRCGDLPAEEEKEGVRIHRTWALRKRADICHTHEMATYLPGAWPRLRRLVRERPDVVHCHFLLPAGPLAYLAARRAGVPWVATAHGSDVPGYNPERFGLDHKLLRPAWRFLARRADAVVSPSRALEGLILANCPEARVRVIPNGIEVPEYPAVEKDKRIVLCSRLLGRKGFQYALAAMAGLGDQWRVDVIGEGPYREELERVAAEVGVAARFHGWLGHGDPRFDEIYAKGSIFVFPSEAENFPTVLLEAMAAGMAIIASRAGGCPEVVGDAAVLVEPRDTAGIRAALERLTGSAAERAALGAAARRRVELFGWGHIAGEYVRCFEEAIAARRRR